MTTRIARPNPAKAEKAVREWNEKYPANTNVEVTRDDGSITETYTLSAAWVLGGHSAVVLLNGISGCYALERVRYLKPSNV